MWGSARLDLVVFRRELMDGTRNLLGMKIAPVAAPTCRGRI